MDPKVCVIFHCGYAEEWEFYKAYLRNVPCPYDFYVTVCVKENIAEVEEVENEIRAFKKDVILKRVENRGLDGGGWIVCLSLIFAAQKTYDYVLKLHTKSPQNFSAMWRVDLLTPLLGNKDAARRCLKLFESNPKIGMIGAHQWIRATTANAALKEFAEKLGLPYLEGVPFVGGTMFWARFEPLAAPFRAVDLNKIFDNFSVGYHSFRTEGHLLERMYGIILAKANLILAN